MAKEIFRNSRGFVTEDVDTGCVRIMVRSVRNYDGIVDDSYTETCINYRTGLYQYWGATGYRADYYDCYKSRASVISHAKRMLNEKEEKNFMKHLVRIQETVWQDVVIIGAEDGEFAVDDAECMYFRSDIELVAGSPGTYVESEFSKSPLAGPDGVCGEEQFRRFSAGSLVFLSNSLRKFINSLSSYISTILTTASLSAGGNMPVFRKELYRTALGAITLFCGGTVCYVRIELNGGVFCNVYYGHKLPTAEQLETAFTQVAKCQNLCQDEQMWEDVYSKAPFGNILSAFSDYMISLAEE